MKFSDIFRENTEARKKFANYYVVGMLGAIATVLFLLFLFTSSIGG